MHERQQVASESQAALVGAKHCWQRLRPRSFPFLKVWNFTPAWHSIVGVCPWVSGLARLPIPRRGTAPAHRSGDGSNAEETFRILGGCDTGPLTSTHTGPDPGWSLCSCLLGPAGLWGGLPPGSLSTLSAWSKRDSTLRDKT